MKEIYRSRRLRLPRRRRHHQVTKSRSSDDDDDESDFEQPKSIIRSNKNANQMPAALFDTPTTSPTEKHQHQTLHSSSDQSSLFLYSINSLIKPIVVSDDITPLTVTTTNTTPLTALTISSTKQIETVKIDLTELTGTDTLDSSSIDTDHDQSLSLDRKISSANINNQIKDFTHAYDTDTSMRSVAFSKHNSLDEDVAYQKHASCFTIPGVGNGDCMTIVSSSVMQGISVPTIINTHLNTCQRPPIRWNPSRWQLQNMTSRLKFFIGCSSLSLIAGLVILVIIL